MLIGAFCGKKDLDNRVRSMRHATLIGAVIAMPFTACAQPVTESDLFSDLRVHAASRARAASIDTFRSNWTMEASGATPWPTGRMPRWTDPRQVANSARASTDTRWAATAGTRWADPTCWTTRPLHPSNINPAGSTRSVFFDAVGPNHAVTRDTGVDVQSLAVNAVDSEFVRRASSSFGRGVAVFSVDDSHMPLVTDSEHNRRRVGRDRQLPLRPSARHLPHRGV